MALSLDFVILFLLAINRRRRRPIQNTAAAIVIVTMYITPRRIMAVVIVVRTPRGTIVMVVSRRYCGSNAERRVGHRVKTGDSGGRRGNRRGKGNCERRIGAREAAAGGDAETPALLCRNGDNIWVPDKAYSAGGDDQRWVSVFVKEEKTSCCRSRRRLRSRPWWCPATRPYGRGKC